MLLMNVSQLLKESIGSTRVYDIRDAVFIASDFSSEVRGGARMTRTNCGILIQAKLKTKVKITCSRCLSSFMYPVEMNIEEEYSSVIDVNTGAMISLPDELDGFTISEHHILDLTEAIRQYALLAIPIKPLCREDCTGVCPSCDQNLDLDGRDCLPHESDPRWAKLQELVLTNEIPLSGRERKK